MRKSCDYADRVILKIAAEARDPVTVRYDGRNCENIDAYFRFGPDGSSTDDTPANSHLRRPPKREFRNLVSP